MIKEIEEQNKKVEKIKKNLSAFLKIIVSVGLLMGFLMCSWNLFFHGQLGLGQENWTWWVWCLPTIMCFGALRYMSPVWLALLDWAWLVWYSFLGYAALGLIWWLG